MITRSRDDKGGRGETVCRLVFPVGDRIFSCNFSLLRSARLFVFSDELSLLAPFCDLLATLTFARRFGSDLASLLVILVSSLLYPLSANFLD